MLEIIINLLKKFIIRSFSVKTTNTLWEFLFSFVVDSKVAEDRSSRPAGLSMRKNLRK